MKTGIVVIILFICSGFTFCQNNFVVQEVHLFSKKLSEDTILRESNKKLKLREKDTTGFTFPLQAGAEYGFGTQYSRDEDKNYKFLNVFLDINLFKKILFVTLDYGQLRNAERGNLSSAYLSLGVKFRALNIRSHNIYLHAGLVPYYAPILVVSTRYMYALNSFLGLSVWGEIY